MTAEPRVEELLATIRKAIDNDISQLDLAQAKAGQGRGLGASMSAMRVGPATPAPASAADTDENLARLRERVARQKIEDRVSAAPPPALPPRPVERIAPRADGVSGILSGGAAQARRIAPELLRPSYADDVPPQQPAYAPPPPGYPPQQAYQPVQDAQWVEEAPPPPQGYYAPQAQPSGALMSPQAAYATQASFQALADSMMAHLSSEGQLQDYAQQLLRPLLKQWLDDNLPQLVERLVREEIERVARRGR